MKKAILAIALILVIGGASTWLLAMSINSNDQPRAKVILYDHGRENEIDPQSSEFNLIIETGEHALISSNDMFSLLVFPEDIKKIEQQQESIEIIYPKQKEFKVTAFTKPRALSRLLFDLTSSDSIIIYLG